MRIKYDRASILPLRTGPLKVHQQVDDRVGVIRLFPGIRPDWVRHALSMPDLKAVVLTTFGSGNGPTDEAFLDALRDAVERGAIFVNVTQCVGGRVEQGRYQTSRAFVDMGMVSAHDMTVEAAVTKLMFLLGQGLSDDLVRERSERPICGEVNGG